MEGDDSTRNTKKSESSETTMEQEEQVNQDRGNLSTSDIDDNTEVEMRNPEDFSEDAVRGDRSSRSTDQASAGEASSPLSPSQSSLSLGSHEDDVDVSDTEDGSHSGLNDEDSNNYHSDAVSSYTGESDNEEDSDYDFAPQSPPRVLNKTLPKQNFSIVKEIASRQLQDNFKRKRAVEFGTKIYGSCKMVQRLQLFGKLRKHTGCVNSIFFNDTGSILVSASDDRRVCIWHWTNKKKLLCFHTGHSENVFQAKFLPNTNDTRLITCGADSEIRMMLLDESGFRSSELIVKHERSVHKLALQRQMPNTFLSAGEDGAVYSIDVRESGYHAHKLLGISSARRKPNLLLYSIDCNPLKNHEFIVCGNDRIIRLYDQRRISSKDDQPVQTFSPVISNSGLSRYLKSATSAVYNYNGTEILASYNDNFIYLFDSSSPEEVHRYDGHRNLATIKGVDFYGPRSEYVVSGSDCGYIYIWDKNSEAIVQWLQGDGSIVNCLEPHPSFPVLASSGLDHDVKIWMPTGAGDEQITELPGFQKFNALYGRIYERDSSNDETSEDDEWLSLN